MIFLFLTLSWRNKDKGKRHGRKTWQKVIWLIQSSKYKSRMKPSSVYYAGQKAWLLAAFYSGVTLSSCLCIYITDNSISISDWPSWSQLNYVSYAQTFPTNETIKLGIQYDDEALGWSLQMLDNSSRDNALGCETWTQLNSFVVSTCLDH